MLKMFKMNKVHNFPSRRSASKHYIILTQKVTILNSHKGASTKQGLLIITSDFTSAHFSYKENFCMYYKIHCSLGFLVALNVKKIQ